MKLENHLQVFINHHATEMCSIVTTNNVRRTSEVSGFSISCKRQIGQGVEQNW